MTTTRRCAGALLSVALLVGVAGCTSPSPTGDAVSTSAAPVVVDHQFGSTTIPANPRRVVTIGSGWSDTLVELGVPITAEFVVQGYAGPDNRFAWTPRHDSTVIPYAASAGAPGVADVARFAPDVILAGYLPDQGVYEQLSKIAPTVPVMAKGAVNDSWQDLTIVAGKIFGKQQRARQAVDDVDTRVAAVAAEYPAARRKTFSFGQLTADRQFGVVASSGDPSSRLLEQVGLTLDPAVRNTGANGQRVIVSAERIDLLRSDLLIFWPLVGGPETFAAIPGWNDLPAVRSGATVFLTNDDASGFGAPSVLSVPWAVEKLRPALARLR
ncbi:ABC transporter substrate-binding protein [Williamsia sterculiae]|uniref:Iron complex transport system substrate-binding protein n=1 Tax=Williamsia sterculiae TaxID=1344003 RepID=A0A1N7DHQ6_9NOCA|nr:ABC transporter substrate-binding protein [Williamsia sterculiae]SIR75352.1 iron complex transport system substrate-binding protein [Williamsia sterculiae]